MAPFFRIVRSLSGTISSGSIVCSTPRPSQDGQAPKGLLKENRRGSISEMVKPETGQANFSEKMMRSGFGFLVLLVGHLDDGNAIGHFQRGLEGIGEARGEVWLHHKTVDDHVDIVLDILVERRGASAIS